MHFLDDAKIHHHFRNTQKCGIRFRFRTSKATIILIIITKLQLLLQQFNINNNEIQMYLLQKPNSYQILGLPTPTI